MAESTSLPSLSSHETTPPSRAPRMVHRRATINGMLRRGSTPLAWEAGGTGNISRGGAPVGRLSMVGKFHTIEPGFRSGEEGREARLMTHAQSTLMKRPSRAPRRVRTVNEDFAVRGSDIENGGRASRRSSKGQSDIAKHVLFADTGPSVTEAARRPSHDVRAPLLANKHRLKLFEVKHILEGFDSMIKTATLDGANEEVCRISPAHFTSFLCHVFEMPSVPQATADSAYQASQGDDDVITAEAFLEWYTINMFTVVSTLNADSQLTSSNELIYNLAKKHQVSTMIIDKVKAKFDMYDTDGSGEIDLDEFRYLLTVLLKVKSEKDLSQDRVMRAWKEIDSDHSGGVDFAEFTQWYLKYLGPTDADMDIYARGPAEAYYDSFNPMVQRRNILNQTHFEDEW